MVAVSPTDQVARINDKLRRDLSGPLLNLMADDRTEDICLNPDGRLWAYIAGQKFVEVGSMSEEQAHSIIATVASCRQTVVNHDRPILETELPLNDARFEGIVPPVVRKPSFAIRMPPRRVFGLDHYKSAGILTSARDSLNTGKWRRSAFLDSVQGLDHTEIIRKAAHDRLNILIVGSAGAGKTTLANAILDTVAKVAPNDRVITVEDTFELRCDVGNHIDLRAIGNVSLDDCVRASLRLRPTRIVVGEVRGPEALKLLKSWATGHPGGVATVHGNGALGGLIQLENLVAEATSAPKQALIAETIHLVVFIEVAADVPAGRKVCEVAVVSGYENGRYLLSYV